MSASSTLYDPKLSEDQTWLIDPDRSDGGIVANAVAEDMPEYTRGEDLTLTFLFWDDAGMTHQAGFTLGDTDGATLGDQWGGVLGADDDFATHIDRYEAARQYLDYAGSASVNQAITGQPHYTERLPSGAAVSSIVVKLVPGPGLESTNGIWGIVMGGDDSTRFPRDMASLRMRFTVLAEASEYDTRSDIQSALGGSVV